VVGANPEKPGNRGILRKFRETSETRGNCYKIPFTSRKLTEENFRLYSMIFNVYLKFGDLETILEICMRIFKILSYQKFFRVLFT